MAGVEDGGEVVGAALLPVPDAVGLLGLPLAALDVHAGLVTQHHLRLVWKYINLIREEDEKNFVLLVFYIVYCLSVFCRYFVRLYPDSL